MYDNLYFETVRLILDGAITRYCQTTGLNISQVDQEIVAYIEDTANQHRNPDPDINYRNPLCRLGYLYVHASVNAALFEQTILQSPVLSDLIKSRANDKLSVCAVGGGPGTELLSLAKHALITQSSPRAIEFAVLDDVQEWSETWNQLKSRVQDRLRSDLGSDVGISGTFLQMDVTSPASYGSFAWLFEATDIFVFNYLLSENQVHLGSFQCALTKMVMDAPKGSIFAFIDRLEYDTNSQFSSENVLNVVLNSKLEVCNRVEFSGCISDEEYALNPYISRFSPRRPRRWYRTQQQRRPTAFAIVARKPVS